MQSTAPCNGESEGPSHETLPPPHDELVPPKFLDLLRDYMVSRPSQSLVRTANVTPGEPGNENTNTAKYHSRAELLRLFLVFQRDSR